MSIRSKMAGKGCALRSRKTTMKSSLKNEAAYLKAKIKTKFLKPEPPNPRSGAAAINALAGSTFMILLAMILMSAFASGCAMQPSRAQTMTIKDNTINVYLLPPAVPGALCYSSNAVPAGVAGGDVLCQAMMIETGGNESNAQTASADPALNLPVGDTAVSALGELIGAAITGGVKAATKDEEPKPATTTP